MKTYFDYETNTLMVIARDGKEYPSAVWNRICEASMAGKKVFQIRFSEGYETWREIDGVWLHAATEWFVKA